MPEYGGTLLDSPKILGVEKILGHQLEIMLQVKTKAGSQYEVSRAWKRLIKQAFERAAIPFHEHFSFEDPFRDRFRDPAGESEATKSSSLPPKE
jgi:small-conductance mechanosensitive channel